MEFDPSELDKVRRDMYEWCRSHNLMEEAFRLGDPHYGTEYILWFVISVNETAATFLYVGPGSRTWGIPRIHSYIPYEPGMWQRWTLGFDEAPRV